MTITRRPALLGHRTRRPPVTVCVLVEERYLDQQQPAGVIGALARRGVQVRTVVAEGTAVELTSSSWLDGSAVVLARGRSNALLGLLRSAEQAGVPVVNRSAAVRAVVDKAGMAAALAGAGLPTPRSWLGHPARLAERRDLLFPMILKPVTGDNARGLAVVRSRAELAALPWPETVALGQEFHRGDGVDVKLYVAGERVWAVRRPSPVAPDGSRRPSDDAGTPVPVTAEMQAVAVRCAALFRLGLLGVDCVHAPDGTMLVVEVNDFPNYRGLSPQADDVLADHVLAVAAARDGAEGRQALTA